MEIFRALLYSGFWGAPRNRGLSYYKSVGIRHFFVNIEGRAFPDPKMRNNTICLRILTVFKHVEVGSSPKEPDFDLFARVGRRGGGPG